MTSRIPQSSSDRTCIHFGFINDDKTAMGYPSMQNYCHQCEPPNTPNLAHQREYCLSVKHKECPLFAATKIGPMPKEMAMDKPREKRKSRKVIAWMVVLVFFVGLIAAAWFFLPLLGIYPDTYFAAPTRTSTFLPIVPEEIPTSTLTLTATSPTELPTLTPTLPTPHSLEIPFGLKQQLVVHQVKDGESFTSIAALYSTTVDAIKSINVIVDTLQVNSLVVVPLGQTNVTGIPQLKVMKVDETTTTLAEIAKEYGIDAELLTEINQLPETCVFKTGDWVLIPILNSAQ